MPGGACRHAATRHDQDGACTTCETCPGYAATRRHAWREMVVESWWNATVIWEHAREAAGARLRWSPYGSTPNTEWREFEEHNPPPRLADHMRGLAR